MSKTSLDLLIHKCRNKYLYPEAGWGKIGLNKKNAGALQQIEDVNFQKTCNTEWVREWKSSCQIDREYRFSFMELLLGASVESQTLAEWWSSHKALQWLTDKTNLSLKKFVPTINTRLCTNKKTCLMTTSEWNWCVRDNHRYKHVSNPCGDTYSFTWLVPQEQAYRQTKDKNCSKSTTQQNAATATTRNIM